MPDMNYNHRRHRPNETERPQIIEFVNCQRIRISGVTIKNAANWVQTYSLCDHLTIDRIWVESDAFWNNDGIDVDDCTNVRISNCDVNAADDGICLKSEHSDACCDNIVIENCRVRSSASAVKFGTASHGGFRNITVRNISVYDTYRSAVALEAVDGGTLENVDVSDIYVRNTGNVIFIRLGHRNVGGAVGAARNIRILRVRAEVPFSRPDTAYDLRGPGLSFFHNPIPASITGIPGYCVEDVTLEDIEITSPGRANKGMAYIPLSRLSAVPENEAGYPEFTMFEELPAWGLYIRHARGMMMKNIFLRLKNDDFRPAYVLDDVQYLDMDDINFAPSLTAPQVVLQDVRHAAVNVQKRKLLQILEGCSELDNERQA
jgi:polygalacturonase